MVKTRTGRRFVISALLLALATCFAGPAKAAGEAPAATPPGAESAASPAPVPDIAPVPNPAGTPIVTPRPARAAAAPAEWGVLLRGGYFGLPDTVADELFRQHPAVEGSIYGVELRYHGDGGARGVLSVGLALDYGTTEADGFWQTDEFDKPIAASGKITMTAATVTAYWNIFPSWYVHPYVGIGIGAAYLKGSYHKDDDAFEVETWFPAINIPAGIAVELGERFQVAAEARFIDGISVGGALQVRF